MRARHRHRVPYPAKPHLRILAELASGVTLSYLTPQQGGGQPWGPGRPAAPFYRASDRKKLGQRLENLPGGFLSAQTLGSWPGVHLPKYSREHLSPIHFVP